MPGMHIVLFVVLQDLVLGVEPESLDALRCSSLLGVCCSFLACFCSISRQLTRARNGTNLMRKDAQDRILTNHIRRIERIYICRMPYSAVY
jgi:hypothetical protein